MKLTNDKLYISFSFAVKNALIALIFICSIGDLQAQWQAYSPVFSDTLGAFDLRIAQNNDQVAWCVAMKYEVTPNTYAWLPSEKLSFAKTSDGGNTWTGGSIPMGPEPYASNLCPISAQTAWASGLDIDYVSYVLRTDDGGTTWTRQLENGFSDAASYVNFVHFWDDQNGVAMGDPTESDTDPVPFFEIYTTADGGLTWTRVPSANIPPPVANEYGSSAVYHVRGNYVWFLTLDGVSYEGKRLFRSKDRGHTWQVLSAADDKINIFSFADTLHGLGAKRISPTMAKLIYTTDGGDTWTDLPLYATSEPATSYVLIPESNYILMTRRANNLTGPFRTMLSKDLGQSWIELGISENAAALKFSSPTVGYAGEWQPADHATRMYKYAGSPLVGLFSGMELDARVTLGPNPASDFLNVRLEVAEPAEFTLMLHDTQGRLIDQKNLEKTVQGNAHFDLSNVPAGIYTLTVSTEKGHLTRTISKL